MLKDSLAFVGSYTRGVPTLNLCKPDENGSPPWLWPVGGRAISYRWEKKPSGTAYVYLQSNPAVYAFALLGFIFGASLSVARFLGAQVDRLPWLATLSASYAGCMLVVFRVRRVMYLYHYLVPLLFGLMAFVIVLSSARRIGLFGPGSLLRRGFEIWCFLISVIFFFYYSPFTYARPLSDPEFKEHILLDVWDLKCARCERTNGFAVPMCDPKIKPASEVVISGVRPELVFQEWGDPKLNKTVTGGALIVGNQKYESGIGVHARSQIRFGLRSVYSKFRASVGVTSDVNRQTPGGTVIFVIRTEGREIWRSPTISKGQPAVPVEVSLAGVDKLSLEVEGGPDGNGDDHAAWLEPVFEK